MMQQLPHSGNPEPRLVFIETPGQVEALAALAREIWEEHYTPLIGPAQVAYMLEHFQSPAAIRRQCADGLRYAAILPPGVDTWAGYLAWHSGNPTPADLFLSKLYVRPSARRQGLAAAAIDFLLDLARREGRRRIWLTVNRGNTLAIRSYQALGFVREGELVQDIGGGFVMDDHVYARILP